ncbi:excisionase [Paenibacillus odorifer]|uniref:Excisionase n=2 Tax=Paenibacillus odorifer TaxID=189426 RepID=A0A1R0Y711_9BACL|nr:excisionase [Paenibacillus odorifer]
MESTINIKPTAVMSVADIQQALGIGRRQAYELVHSGKFHTVKAGRRILVSSEVFYTWMTQPTD